jgi:hypothetical protein
MHTSSVTSTMVEVTGKELVKELLMNFVENFLLIQNCVSRQNINAFAEWVRFGNSSCSAISMKDEVKTLVKESNSASRSFNRMCRVCRNGEHKTIYKSGRKGSMDASRKALVMLLLFASSCIWKMYRCSRNHHPMIHKMDLTSQVILRVVPVYIKGILLILRMLFLTKHLLLH